MKEIKQTPEFVKWFNSLRDFKITKVVARKINKLSLGITSHIKSLGRRAL